MPKPKKHPAARPVAAATTPPDRAPLTGRFGVAEGVALFAAALCLLLTWLSRNTLNPDGVSYLDLATRLAQGDWSSFVQGYWSPLYPALVALVSAIVGREPVTLIATAHAISGVFALLTIALLWWWGRALPGRLFGGAAVATFLLISAGLPRIEAVTPDVVLLAIMAGIGYELLPRRGERWLLLGLLLGAAFLTKTSAWPWLLVMVPLRLWGARDRTERWNVMRSSLVAIAVMLTWIVPMSRKAGAPSFGSASSLNTCWYLEACDSRTPDTHLGGHRAYHQVNVDSAGTLVWAEFATGEKWTYAPWSDPTAWSAGVLSNHSIVPTAWDLVSYWTRQFRNTFGLWLLPVLLGILLPSVLLLRRAGRWRALLAEDRMVLVTALLGFAGVMQFVLIHSEPRLIAPFGLLLALAVLHWASSGAATPRGSPLLLHPGVTLLGMAGAIGFAVPRLQEGWRSSMRIDGLVNAIAHTDATMRSAGMTQERIVVLGPAIPIEASAYLSGAHIVAQLLPSSVEVLKRLPTDQQQRVIGALFSGKADIAWLTTLDAGVTMVVIPKPGDR